MIGVREWGIRLGEVKMGKKEWIDDDGCKIVDEGDMRTVYRPEENLSLPSDHPQRKDGAGTKWHQGKMKENNKHGLWTGYHITGEKNYEGTWKDGKEHGTWTYYFIDGSVMDEEVWEDGVQIDEKPPKKGKE